MLSIGEFASIGRVTVRSLRYYDEIGLLRPAAVDPSSGYRWYAPAQAQVLTRILQLRDFGLRLDDIIKIINGDLDTRAEQHLLQTARETLASEIENNSLRLERLEAYLKTTEGQAMPATIPVEVLQVAPQRVAYLTDHAGGWGSRHIGPVIGPLFGRLAGILADTDLAGLGPAIAIYEADESGDQTSVRVTAAFVIGDVIDDVIDHSLGNAVGDNPTRDNAVGDNPTRDNAAGNGAVPAGTDLSFTTLPPIESAAIAVHQGEVATIDQSWHALTDWVATNGYEMTGICREVYLTPPDVPQSDWVTQLQQPVGRADRPAPVG